MQRVIVLGGGMVGSAMGADLCNEYEVTIADNNSERLNDLKSIFNIKTLVVDFNTADLAGLSEGTYSIQVASGEYDQIVGTCHRSCC